METSTDDPAVSRMLLQLNLHKALEHCFRGHQIFSDLRRKQEGDAIFGKAYIAESAIRLNEAFFGNCFHLNALTGGGRTELFSRLDTLKGRINKLVDTSEDCADKSARGDADDCEDEVSRLLARVIKETTDSGQPASTTAGDMLACLSTQTLEAVEQQLVAWEGSKTTAGFPLTTVPVDYAGFFEESAELKSNESVGLIAESMTEVAALTGVAAMVPPAEAPPLKATILHSPNTLTLLADSALFKGVVGSAVFDDAAGNYIHLLIAPLDENRDTTAVRQLLLRSLYWLDFDTTESRKIICAGIRHLTLEEMRDHLSMLGKLLPYAAVTGGGLGDEDSIRSSMDYFLETVV